MTENAVYSDVRNPTRTRTGAVVRRASDEEWQTLETRAPFPHLTQSRAYGEAKSAGHWRAQRYVIETQDGKPLAYLTALRFKILGLTLLTRVSRGPVFLDEDPRPEDVRSAFAAIRRRWRFGLRGPLLIAPNLERTPENRALLNGLGYKMRQDRTWGSGRLDLRRAESDLWSNCTSSFRNHARKAEKAGARLSVSTDRAAFDWMLERHRENMRVRSFNGTDPALLERLRAAAAQDDVIVFRLDHDGSAVSGGIVVRFGDTCEYFVGWIGPEGRKIDAGNHMLWRMITEMKQRGCHAFDVGGISDGNGYSQFKRGVKPLEYDLVGEWLAI